PKPAASQPSAPAAPTEDKLRAENYSLGPLEFAKQTVTEFSEMELIGRKLRERACIDEMTTGRRWTRDDWVKHAKEYPLSNGRRIEPRVALVMMTIFSPTERMKGGRPPNPENLNR